jgi:hypothetical protein
MPDVFMPEIGMTAAIVDQPEIKRRTDVTL